MSMARCLEILEQLAQTSGTNKKKEIIGENRLVPGFRNVAVYAYHPLLQFNILSIPGNYCGPGKESDHKSIFLYLKYLSSKRGATAQERDHLDSLCTDKATVEVVNRILNKDLRCGAGPILFGKHFTIPNPEPMLCEDDLEKMIKKVDGDISRLVWSLKLDGVRTRASKEGYDSPVKYISRNGKVYENFYIFDPAIDHICRFISERNGGIWPITIDGEVSSKDKDFQKQMTQVRRLNEADPSIFVFDAFDIAYPDTDHLSEVTLEERLGVLRQAIGDGLDGVRYLEHVDFEEGTTLQDILDLADKLCDQGEEGIVVKDKKSLYQTGRTWEWTKVKKFYTEDLPVVGKEEGTGKHKGRLGALIVERYLGQDENSDDAYAQVRVGSGYTDEERDQFWSSPPKLIEVKYQNVTKDGSLRFPVFIRVREDKRG